MSSSLSKDLIFLILQFLDEERFKETVHWLERESGLFFSLKYFEELVMDGKWEDVESYVSGFTKVEDNRYSMKIFFEIRKQKYLEALDKCDRGSAVEILVKDLKCFASYNEELFKEITNLVTLDNFRENDQLSNYRDTKSARETVFMEVKKLIVGNPVLLDKLEFPNLRCSRLRALINQSLNWQHSLCGNQRQNPDIRTLFVDHKCRNPNDPNLATTASLIGSAPRPEGSVSMAANGLSLPASGSIQTPLTKSMHKLSTIAPPSSGSGSGLSFGGVNPGVAAISKGLGDFDSANPRIFGVSERIVLPGSNMDRPNRCLDELPKTVARSLNQGSVPTSLDFHPIQQTILLVGTGVGDISLWEVSSRDRWVSKSFKLWDIGSSSMILKAAIVKDPCVSVNRVLWSRDGSLFGVAYSKHMVQLYTYHGGSDVRNHTEIDAHIGGVNDLAFCNPTQQLSLITCGDDRTVKVWDVSTGARMYTFEGHEAPVYSVCPHTKEDVHFIFSTSVDGKIKAWLYDVTGPRVDYEAPGRACTTMAYSSDGKRLFSCGTSQDWTSHMVEWNENEGSIKRTYLGFHGRSLGIVQFDTAKNRFLAVGDSHSIKFWDMDNPNLLFSTEAEGGLPPSPRIRLNKDGTLLAVTANDNRIKILATVDGLTLMRACESRSLAAFRVGAASEMPVKAGDVIHLDDVNPRLRRGAVSPAKMCNLTEIKDPSQLRSLRVSAPVKIHKIAKLMYTHSGHSILALAFNAIHLLWRWPCNETNSSRKATTKVAPQLVQPPSGILMTNDLVGSKPQDAVPCFALSKNDSYVMSSSGGKVSLFNTTTFKTMATFMPPPPAVTYIVFHPQDNNVIAVGMDDATINIYNVQLDQVTSRLKSHSKRISGLTFSQPRKVLVSSGADCQIIVWSMDKWEQQVYTFLKIPAGSSVSTMSDMKVQFFPDQLRLLAVHETQLAVYEVTRLECVKRWISGESSAAISEARLSCDGQLVYSSFLDGTLRIFGSKDLHIRCQISPSAYIPSEISSMPSLFVMDAHPKDPNQFAVGLADGVIIVLEPLESGSSWGGAHRPPPVGNGAAACSIPPATMDQPQCLD